MHNFYFDPAATGNRTHKSFENNGPIEKFLEISKDFSHNRCIEKTSKWIFLIFCIFRLKSSLRDWSLITGRGGLQNGKIAGPKLFAPPPKTG